MRVPKNRSPLPWVTYNPCCASASNRSFHSRCLRSSCGTLGHKSPFHKMSTGVSRGYRASITWVSPVFQPKSVRTDLPQIACVFSCTGQANAKPFNKYTYWCMHFMWSTRWSGVAQVPSVPRDDAAWLRESRRVFPDFRQWYVDVRDVAFAF